MSDKITILYVDDEYTNLMLFRINFQKKYNVITSYSGIEGLEQLRTHPEIVIVISDMKMPGMDGLEFIKKAKSEFPDVVFFILTGYDITPEIENALESELISKYFSKPFKLTEIEEAINQVIIG
jgi:two-component system, response regulator, stage 0 sporulation protein F